MDNKWIVTGALVFVAFLALGATFKVTKKAVDHTVTQPQPQTTARTPLAESVKVTVEAVNINFSRSIELFGEVTDESINSAISKLDEYNATSSQPVYILIASPGGSVFAGEQLLSAMESSRAPVYTVCTSLCASMAAIIHQYGTQRYAFDRSILMFHDASGGVQGEVKKMQSMLTMIERKIERVDRYIADKSHMSYEKFMDMHKYDLWIDAIDAKQAGLVDKLIRVQTTNPTALGPSAEALLKRYPRLNKTLTLDY